MLKRIRIRGFKSFPDLEVANLGRLCVLFGPNAVGKSNFLDALLLLARLATSQTLKEAFDPPYRGKPLESFSFGAEGLKGLRDKRAASFRIEADVEIERAVVDSVNRQILQMKRTKDDEPEPADRNFVQERRLRYAIEVEVLPKSGFLRVRDEYLAALNADGEPTGKRKPFLSRDPDRPKLVLRMEKQSHPRDVDLGLDHSALSLPLYPPHYPHLAAMKEEFRNWLFYYFEPRDKMRSPSALKEVRHIGLMGEDLASYFNTKRARHEKQFEVMQQALRLIIPSADGLDVAVNDLGEVELSIRERGVSIPARLVSEGTLRVLGLLSLTDVEFPPALVGFEEPENGVHPRRLRMIADLLKNCSAQSQIIVTTHSVLLPDILPAESLYVCAKTDGGTTIRPVLETPLFRRSLIAETLDGDVGAAVRVGERMLRGDFE